jgi:4-amino-4-deoxy-L-arabinose transferase-like glycosyltransferase
MKKPMLIKIINFYQTKKTLVLIILTAVYWIAAIAYSFYLGKALRFPDETRYFTELGYNIATLHIFSADGINLTAYTPPIYPLLVGLLIMIGSGIIGVRLVNFFALFIILFIVYKILERQSLTYSPIISVFLILGYPVLFYTAGTLYPQTIGSLFLVLALYFYWGPILSAKNIIFTGVFLGLAILTIPTFIFVLPFMMLFAYLHDKKILSKMILLAAITLLAISPWTIRNFIVFDRFIPFSTNFGTIFLLGNSSTTTPNDSPAALVGIKEINLEAKNQGLNEFEKNKFFLQSAINEIKNKPGHYLVLYIQKFINYFNFRNELATKSESSPFRDVVMLLTYGFLILVLVFRIFLSRKYPISRFELFLIYFYICSAFVSALFFPRIRYRLPFDFFLIIISSLAIDKFINHQIEKYKQPK